MLVEKSLDFVGLRFCKPRSEHGLSFLAGGFSSGEPLSEPVQHLLERNAFAAVELRNAFSVFFDLSAFAIVEVLP